MEITRWRRFGHDRLFVKDGDVQLGWWDLVADEGHPENGASLDDLTAAVEEKRLEILGERPVVASAPSVVAGAAEAVPGMMPPTPDPIVPASPATPVVPAFPVVPASPATPVDDDLMGNAAAASLQPMIEQARAAGQRPTLFRRLVLGKEATSAWERGAVGEARVARTLAKVVEKDPRWQVIHSVPVGSRGADIDHVVIGPGGVFTLNTKYHPDAHCWLGGDVLLVNGVRQPYVRNSRHEAARAAKKLSATLGDPVLVTGVVVLCRVEDLKVKAAPEDVVVIERYHLKRWLLRRPEILTGAQIAWITEAARHGATWK